MPNKPNQDCINYVGNVLRTFQETIMQRICQKKSPERARGYFTPKFYLSEYSLLLLQRNNLTWATILSENQ